MSLPVPDQGGQVAVELLVAGGDRGGPGPEGGEALPGVDTADALGTGQGMSDSNSLWNHQPPQRGVGASQDTLSYPRWP